MCIRSCWLKGLITLTCSNSRLLWTDEYLQLFPMDSPVSELPSIPHDDTWCGLQQWFSNFWASVVFYNLSFCLCRLYLLIVTILGLKVRKISSTHLIVIYPLHVNIFKWKLQCELQNCFIFSQSSLISGLILFSWIECRSIFQLE